MKIEVLNGSVELIDCMGSDLTVANSARVSFGKSKARFEKGDEKLLYYLARNEHWSPFKHPCLSMRIRCDIATERQLFKHQVGLTANSISGRYVDFSDTYYFPPRWRRQATDNKQGSSDEPFSEADEKAIKAIFEAHIAQCKNDYRRLVDMGVAKEMARYVLPFALQTEFIWSGSLLAFLHVLELRLYHKGFQWEVGQFAKAIETVLAEKFPVSLRVFRDVKGLGAH